MAKTKKVKQVEAEVEVNLPSSDDVQAALFEKQLITEHLIRTDRISERTLMEKAGFDYDTETKNKLVEAADRKKLAHILQSPFKES